MTRSLTPLLAPRTIALVGASPDVQIFRGRTLKVMLGHGYTGRIYPVSRSHAEIQGLRAYPSVAEIPEPIDLAILIIPAEHVPGELERCGAAGVKAVMILSSGFAEARTPVGVALQERVVAIAQRHGMIVCGPNGIGYANTAARLCPTFSPAVDNLAVPLVPPHRTRGHVAVIAQSGGIGFALFDRGRPKDLPFSYIITTGNEACLETFEIVEHLLDEGTTEVFLLFLESIKDPRSFERAASRALAEGKPIIVAKVGRSEPGARASRYHTASIAGDYAAYQAVFRRHGIIEAADLEEMVDIAAAFSLCKGRLPAGNRVGIGTASGGGGGWLADACVAAGLDLPLLDSDTRTALDALIPDYGTSQNPVDATAQAIVQAGYAGIARQIAASSEVDAVLMIVSARATASFEREQAVLAEVAAASTKPILLWSYTLPTAETARILGQAGYPLFTSMQTCARALAELVRYRAIRERRLRASAAAAPVASGSAGELVHACGLTFVDVTAGAPSPTPGVSSGAVSGVSTGAASGASPDAGSGASRGVAIELAIRTDPQLGLLLHLAVNGSAALAAGPLDAEDAAELVARIATPALQAADLPALIDALVRLSRVTVALELDGVTVGPRGSGVAVTGVRFALQTAPGSEIVAARSVPS